MTMVWKQLLGIFLLFGLLTGCASASPPLATSSKKPATFKQSGLASYYADKYHGRKTASGERFDQAAMTAAHRKLRFGTMVRVTNTRNGKSVVVRINDRGPFVKGRVIDLSLAAFKQIGNSRSGVVSVEIEVMR